MEHKFKIGDYVVVKQDARSPVYQDKPLTNWAASLTPGSIHEVDKIGTYKWTKEVNCIIIRELGFYTPEDCFELFSPKHFVAGSYVKCTRIPEDIDWKVTVCGKVQSLQDKLTVGETYKVDNVSSTGNLDIIINGTSEGLYPPTIFESTSAPKTVTSLPEKWIVSLKDVTDEQLGRANTWRKYVTNKCYLSYTLHKTYNLCNHEDGCMFYTGTVETYKNFRENVVEISFQDFERFVLKPWESSVVTSIGGTINAISGTPSPDGSGVSYKYTINSPDSIPNLVIKKQKKIKLLSTEVEDFNVNLSLNIKNQKKCQKQN